MQPRKKKMAKAPVTFNDNETKIIKTGLEKYEASVSRNKTAAQEQGDSEATELWENKIKQIQAVKLKL